MNLMLAFFAPTRRFGLALYLAADAVLGLVRAARPSARLRPLHDEQGPSAPRTRLVDVDLVAGEAR
jgi:hypothetical protein